MKPKKAITFFSPVYIFLTVFMAFALTVLADESSKKADDKDKESSKKTTVEERCDRFVSSAQEAYERISKACKEGGFSRGDCFDKISSCEDEIVEENVTDTTQLWKVLGINIPTKEAPTSKTFCPKYSGTEFMKKRKEYKTDLRDLDSELSDLKKEIAEEQEKLTDDLKKIEDEVKEAQETLEENKAEFSEKRREQLNDFNEQQRKLAEDQRAKEMELLKLEGELVNMNRKLVTEMITLSEEASNRACLGAIRKMRDEVLKLEGQANTIQKARQRKKDLIESYNDCMRTYDQRRTNLMELNKQDVERVTKSINNIKSDLEDQQNALKAAQTQLTEIEKELTDRTTAAEQRFQAISRSAQTRMLALNQTSKQKMEALNEKKLALESEKRSINADLTAMGRLPENTDSTLKAQDVLSEADVGITELANLCKNETCKQFYQETCNELNNSKTQIGKRRSNSIKRGKR